MLSAIGIAWCKKKKKERTKERKKEERRKKEDRRGVLDRIEVQERRECKLKSITELTVMVATPAQRS